MQRGFSFVLAPVEHQRADRAVDHVLPEAASQREFGDATVNLFAPAADKTGEIADSRGQNSLDALADAARHHRRGAAGADGDHHVAAIDDGGKDEGRMRQIVHHIDGQADGFGARRHRNAGLAGARAEDRNHAREIGGQGIAFAKLDPCGARGIQGAEVMLAAGRKPADPRARGRQQPQLRSHQLAGADEQHRTGLQIEKHWQESHPTLAAPTPGVD